MFRSVYFSQAGQAGSTNSSGGPVNAIAGNTGLATPAAGVITVSGTGSIVSAASGSSDVFSLTGLTNHAVLVGAGTATITKVGPVASTGAFLASNGLASDPGFSTATYPLTTTINQILYSSANNTVSELATANRGVLTTGATGVPVITALAADGQLIIGSTAGAPAAATLTAGTGVSITNGSNSITIAASGTANLTVTAVSTSPYVVLSTDAFLAVDSSGGAITVQLPDAPATGKVYYIKDSTGSAVANNITVTTVGGAVNIDGATSYVMATNYQAISVIFDGTSYEVF